VVEVEVVVEVLEVVEVESEAAEEEEAEKEPVNLAATEVAEEEVEERSKTLLDRPIDSDVVGNRDASFQHDPSSLFTNVQETEK